MIELTIAIVLFLFPLAYSPGPGNLFFAANGARFGLRATIPATSGYHITTWIVTLVIGLGFAVVIERYPDIFTVVKVLGSLYVFWLASKLLRAGLPQSNLEPTPANFWDGAILLLLNPKAYFIIAAMFTQFLSPESSDQLGLVLWITTIFTLNNLLAFTLWTMLGNRFTRIFQNDSNAKILNLVFGGLLAAIAVWMLFSS